MKILIVNTFDIHGGAARAAYRLHRALVDAGIDSKMLVQQKESDDYRVVSEEGKLAKTINKIRPAIDRLPVRLYKYRVKTAFSPAWFGLSGIVQKINAMHPDIVHLHWVNYGMLRPEDLRKIKAPIVWSLHDNWLFSGGCHVKWQCDRYNEMCGSCPNLGSDKDNDLSRWVWKRKKKAFASVKEMVIIGLSRWMMRCSEESTLLHDKRHVHLPNPINTAVFKPIEKQLCRSLWGLPEDKRVVLFGAMNAAGDANKGFSQLIEALSLVKSEDVLFVAFGQSEPASLQAFDVPIRYTGPLRDDIALVTLYNTADVTIVPSLQENLSNVIMESLACATPVVAFDVGGNSDLIDHQQNGYLAKAFDAEDLKNGIKWVLDEDHMHHLGKHAREKVLREFDSKIVAEKYIALYKEVISAQ